MTSKPTRQNDTTLGLVPSIARVESLSRFQKARLALFGLVVLLITGFAAVALGELFSLLVLGWTADVGAELGIHRVHVMVIATVIFATLGGVLVQLYRPTTQAAAMLGAVTSVTLAALLEFATEGTADGILPFMAMVGLATLLHPAGRRLLHREQSSDTAMAVLVVVGAIPLLAFAAAQVGLQLNANDAHAAVGHYTAMAQLGLIPLVYAAYAAAGFRGRRVAAWLAALPVAYYGLLAVAFPTQAGSTGALWGAAAILWAGAFLASAEYSRFGPTAGLDRPIASQD